MKMWTRKQFLLSLIGTGASAIGYSTLIEPRWLQLQEVSINTSLLPKTPIKLLHLSDLHYSPVVSLSHIEKAIDLAIDQQPDLICITGDFTTDYIPNEKAYAKVLRKLVDAAPTFAVLGNHDGGSWSLSRGGYITTENVSTVVRESGIHLLVNERAVLTIANRDIEIYGMGDWWAEMLKPEIAFSKQSVNKNALKIVLAHNPDSKKILQSYDWDVMLSGHTHGGQIRFPIIGTPFAPVRDKRFVAGAYNWENRWLHISRGVGNVRGVRFNCPPEINVLQIT